MSVKSRIIAGTIGCLGLVGGSAAAAPVFVDQDKGISVNLGVLLQPQFQITAAGSEGQGSTGIGAPDGKSPSFDFLIRRVRLMAYGTITKDLAFFVETDQPNWGKGGDFTTPTMYIQDAFLSYTFAPEFKIDAGMMLVPFSHHTIEGAIGLNTLDYHADMIRLPAGKVWRDNGVQFRGMLGGTLIHYRLGIFEGVRASAVPVANPAPAMPPPALNDSGIPRFTGQVRLNLAGAEQDFFLKGIYFSPTPIVSVGLGADFQPHAVYKDGQPSTYSAISADVFAELPLSADDELIAKANFFNYGAGSTGIPGTTPLARGGIALYAEAGFRHDWFEPLAFVEYLKAKDNTLTILAPHIGANFWVTKHTFNLKFDAGYRKTDRRPFPLRWCPTLR